MVRRRLGFSYWSLSAWAKLKVKNAVQLHRRVRGRAGREAREHASRRRDLRPHPLRRDAQRFRHRLLQLRRLGGELHRAGRAPRRPLRDHPLDRPRGGGPLRDDEPAPRTDRRVSETRRLLFLTDALAAADERRGHNFEDARPVSERRRRRDEGAVARHVPRHAVSRLSGNQAGLRNAVGDRPCHRGISAGFHPHQHGRPNRSRRRDRLSQAGSSFSRKLPTEVSRVSQS